MLYLFGIGLAAQEEENRPRFPLVFEANLGFELADTTMLPDGRRLDAVLGMDVRSQRAFSMSADDKCARIRLNAFTAS